jgi:hypothetical protein
MLVLLLPFVGRCGEHESPTPSDGPQFQEWLEEQGSQSSQLDEISLT